MGSREIAEAKRQLLDIKEEILSSCSLTGTQSARSDGHGGEDYDKRRQTPFRTQGLLVGGSTLKPLISNSGMLDGVFHTPRLLSVCVSDSSTSLFVTYLNMLLMHSLKTLRATMTFKVIPTTYILSTNPV